MKTNNFLIVVPQYNSLHKGYVLPLGILAVSAAIKRAGLPIVTLNLNHEKEPFHALDSVIGTQKISWVMTGGLSGEFRDLENLLAYIHAHHPKVHLLLGGGIVTAQPEICMKAFPYVTVGVIGEGDISVPRFVDAVLNNKELSSVSGLILREGEHLYRTRSVAEVADLNNLPFPDYTGFGFHQYLLENSAGLGWNGEHLSPVSIIGSRSCPYHCTFCFHPTGNHYRTRSIENIFAEIDYLYSKYPFINHLALREELFATEKGRIREFCERIKRYNFYWSIQLRINQVTKEILFWLKDAGCFNIFLGIESADDKVLRSMKKGITREQIEDVLDMADEIGVMVRSGMIFGDPIETEDSFRFSMDWMLAHRKYDEKLRRYNIYPDMLIPFPGSEIFRDAVQRGLIQDQIGYLRAGCPPVNLTQMSDEYYCDILREVQKYNGKTYYVWNEQWQEKVRCFSLAKK